MKISALSLPFLLAALLNASSALSQTNDFPPSGDVGIGTTSPNDALEVKRASGNVGIRLVNEGNGSGDYAALRIYQGGSEKGVIYTHAEDMIINRSGSGNLVMMRTGGNVGIGTSYPDYKLDVSGIMRAKEIKVETNWSDYVFEEDYYLMPLDEVEAHIEEHGHLPDVPSAKTIQAEGLSVGESQAMLMRKVEELTLYMLEMQKEKEALLCRVEELEAKLEAE